MASQGNILPTAINYARDDTVQQLPIFLDQGWSLSIYDGTYCFLGLLHDLDEILRLHWLSDVVLLPVVFFEDICPLIERCILPGISLLIPFAKLSSRHLWPDDFKMAANQSRRAHNWKRGWESCWFPHCRLLYTGGSYDPSNLCTLKIL